MAYTTQNSARPLLSDREILDRMTKSMSKTMQYGIAVVLLTLALPLAAAAQQNVQAAPDGETGPGKTFDGYIVQQSVEFGGRITDVNGNRQMYDTLINLHDGPRLLGQELIMRSPTHDHGLFDSLYLNSFGYGGDPNNMTRLRIEKSRLYDFVGLYRRDQNFFDVNFFANPLNLNPGIGITLQPPPAAATFNPASMPWFADSPHLQDNTRKMGDFNLTLFPDSRIRARLGYSRNITDGRLETTLETPIRSIIAERDQWRSDRYQFGFDFRVAKRTTISFDHIFEHDKVDPNFGDNNLSFLYNSATVPPGTLVDVGLLFPPSGCTVTAANFTVDPITGQNIFTPSAGCNVGLFNFTRSGRVRSDFHTEQLSLASNYFRKLDVTASGTYSSGNSEFLNYQEFANFANFIVPIPAAKRPTLITGSSNTDRVSGNADLGLTYHVTPHWSASDKFRWFDWRDPGAFDQHGFTCTPAASSPSLTPGTANCVTVAPGNTNFYSTYIAERTYENTAKVNYQTRSLGGYVGYRYQRRELTGYPSGDSAILNSYFLQIAANGGALLPNITPFTTKINEHTALAGIMLRPVPAWRINADVEILSADNSFTNIAPRHQQRARFNTVYKVNRWSSINGGVHFIETRNDFATHINSDSTVNPPFSPASPNLFPTGVNGVNPAYGHKDHWRYFTLGASLAPNPRFSLDFGWTYLDQLIVSDTCVPVGFNALASPISAACANSNNAAVVLPPVNPASTVDVPLVLHYQERTNTGFFVLTVRPVHRVTLNFGYEITSTAGHNRWMNAGGVNGNGELQVLSDIFGNSPPLAGNPIAPCPAAATQLAAGCAFPGPFPDAPLSQALNWHKPYAGISVDICKNVTFKGLYAYYDFNEKETSGLPLVNQSRDFHANTGTLSLKYAF